MRFTKTALPGVMIIELEAHEDERGDFTRTFCDLEFAGAGLPFRPQQINLSRTRSAFTLRGMHYQAAPHAEAKVVHCIRGRIFDVAVDLRPNSPAFRQWTGLELSPTLGRMLHIPEGCAHGFLTLEDDSEVVYLMGRSYASEAQSGVRWDDPVFGIRWPAAPRLMSPRDAAFPDFSP